MKALRIGGIVLLAIVVVVGGFLAWWFLMRAQVPPAAALVPSNTMAFAHVPNGVALSSGYNGSKLKQIVESEEVGALAGLFYVQMLKDMSEEDQAKLAKLEASLENFAYNFSGESFVAVLDFDLSAKAAAPVGLVLGFHPLLGSLQFDAVVEDVRKIMLEADKAGDPAPTAGTGSYSGIDYEYLEFKDKGKLYVAKANGWILTTTKEDLLHATIDRALGKTKAASLQDSAEYKQVLAGFRASPELVTYLNTPEVLKAVYAALDQAAKKAGETEVDLGSFKGMLDFYKDIGSIAFATTFQNDGYLRDEWISDIAPEMTEKFGAMVNPCAYDTLKFTDKSTILYMAGSLDAPAYYKFMSEIYAKMPETAEMMTGLKTQLKAMDLDLQANILEPLGNEYAIVSAWPKKQQIPSFGMMLTLKDAAAFQPVVDKLVETMANYTTMQDGVSYQPGKIVKSTVGDYELRTYRMAENPMIAPTIVTGQNMVAFFLTQQGAAAVLSSPADTNFTKQPYWQNLGLEIKGSTHMSFLNTEAVVERSYAMAAPFLKMAMALDPDMSKQLGDFKLPQKLSFTEDLGAWGQITLNKQPLFEQVSVSSFGSPMALVPALGYLVAEQVKDQQMAAQAAQQQARQRQAVAQATKAKAEAEVAAAAQPDPTSAEAIRDELNDLGQVINAWATKNNVPEGATVEWSSIKSFLIPGSRLAESGGKDALGHAFKLGRVGEVGPDVSWETKKAFPEVPASFWKQAGTEAPSTPTPPAAETPMPPAEAPAN